MKKERIIALMLLAVMLFSGCDKPVSKQGLVIEPGTDGKVTKEPLELTMFMRIMTDAYDFDKQTMFQEAFRDTNIKPIGTSSDAASDATQEFNIMLASSPLPDIIQQWAPNLRKAAASGALMPLDDLIDQYAPNIKKYLDENPWARKGSVAADGKLYYVPLIRGGLPSMGFYIRTDWLKNLNLETPKTVDEYYNVLKAFRERDPNGNGEKDEVPYFNRNGSIEHLVQLWSARARWYIDDDGNYLNGATQPKYKTAMINLAKWYDEGLIDKEIYSRGQQARQILLGSNLGGSTYDWFSSTGAFNDSLSAKVPGFEFKAIAPPADVNGAVKTEWGRSPLGGYGWGMSVDNKYPMETMKYFNYWYSEKGIMLYNYGVEGTDYNMVNGKPVFTDLVLKAPDGAPTYLRRIGQNEMGSISRVDSELQGMVPTAREGYEMYEKNNYVLPQLPSLSYTESEQRTINEKESAINTYMKEVQQKWLFGNESVEAGWEAYLAQLKSMGFDELQTAYQTAYERYLKQ